MQKPEFNQWLLAEIGRSPTAFHLTANIRDLLTDHGFTLLEETGPWQVAAPGSYVLVRNGSSLIAFTLDGEDPARSGLRMAGAHTDSPALKVKPNPLQVSHTCVRVGVEVYGGALLAPWFDRDLSLAGRVSWETETGGLGSGLLDFARPVAVIPSLAIHLDREANRKRSINSQTDIIPILLQATPGDACPVFNDILLARLRHQYPDLDCRAILDHELFFYDPAPPVLTGLEGEFITGPRLDNQLSCWTIARALVDAPERKNSMIILSDHEEVGSGSPEGAGGPLLDSILECLFPEPQQRQQVIRRSLLISADNAHGVHPNFTDRHDTNHLPLINRGPVIKINAARRYATTALTSGFFRLLCRRRNTEVQEFVMRSDMACGSTIGPLTATRTGMQVVDVGVPTLAMHSIREMAGSADCHGMHRVLQEYFSLATDDPLWHGWQS
ncbi:MAG TPA: M18 family aminopeptidase [Desulfobulbus sp.]|nr:M18 family aminopeptidase [Desulfobulbus sp.]